MLDEICPVQFVEGINECAKASEEEYINTMGYSGIAIEYEPKLTYSLRRFQIFVILAESSPEGFQHQVALCADHKNNPSDIVLSKGTWVSETGYIQGWQEVELEPVVVIRGKKYWLTIDLNERRIDLPISKEGEVSALRFRGGKKWITHDIFKTDRVILRFYGRILPINPTTPKNPSA